MLYLVQITEKLTMKVCLEANDREEALATAMEGYSTGEVMLDKENNMAGVNFVIEEEEHD